MLRVIMLWCTLMSCGLNRERTWSPVLLNEDGDDEEHDTVAQSGAATETSEQ